MPEERHGKMTREETGRRGAEAKAETILGLKDVDTIEMHIIDDIKYPASKGRYN